MQKEIYRDSLIVCQEDLIINISLTLPYSIISIIFYFFNALFSRRSPALLYSLHENEFETPFKIAEISQAHFYFSVNTIIQLSLSQFVYHSVAGIRYLNN